VKLLIRYTNVYCAVCFPAGGVLFVYEWPEFLFLRTDFQKLISKYARDIVGFSLFTLRIYSADRPSTCTYTFITNETDEMEKVRFRYINIYIYSNSALYPSFRKQMFEYSSCDRLYAYFNVSALNVRIRNYFFPDRPLVRVKIDVAVVRSITALGENAEYSKRTSFTGRNRTLERGSEFDSTWIRDGFAYPYGIAGRWSRDSGAVSFARTFGSVVQWKTSAFDPRAEQYFGAYVDPLFCPTPRTCTNKRTRAANKTRFRFSANATKIKKTPRR